MRDGSFRRRAPPWWPANEPWPPLHGRFVRDRRARIRFFRVIAALALAMSMFMLSAISVAAWIAAQRFGAIGSSAAAVGVLAIGLVLVTMTGAMRRFISPLRQVMDAADRVADGDYTARVRESGPPPMRALAHSF